MVRVGPTPPSAGTLGSSRSQHAGSSARAAASSTFRHRTVITNKDDPPRGTGASRGYQTTAARGEKPPATRWSRRPRGVCVAVTGNAPRLQRGGALQMFVQFRGRPAPRLVVPDGAPREE